MDRAFRTALCSLIFNAVYGAYNVLFGVLSRSYWLFTVGVYYAILGAVRFAVLRSGKAGRSVARGTGVMLLLLVLPLVGTVVLSVVESRGLELHLIVMLVMAMYAFTKVTLATVNLVKLRKSRLPRLVALKNISLADALVSMFSLQRSMLVSFEGMTAAEIGIMNIATGSAVCVAVLLLGMNLVSLKRGLFKNIKQ